jgi:hypothetical protein
MAALQSSEDNLSHLALVATIAGNRPFVSTAMIQDALFERFQINAEDADVKVHEPEDFLVCFARREDRDRVLSSRPWGALMPLRWRPWTRMSAAVAGAFQFRVVLALRNMPAHARDPETAQRVLGRCCAHVETTDLRDRPPEDDREYFVSAWCWHPQLIQPQQLLFIPEPRIQCSDVSENTVRRGLHYLVHVRVVAYQNIELPGDEPPDDDRHDQADEHGDWDEDDRYCPTPRQNSDSGSDSSDPRHRNSHPFCDYPSDWDGGQQDDACLALQVGKMLCPISAKQFQPASTPKTRTPEASTPSSSGCAGHARGLDNSVQGLRSPEIMPERAQSPPRGFVGFVISEAPALLQAGGFAAPVPSCAEGDWWATIAEDEFHTPALLRARPANAPLTADDVQGNPRQPEANGQSPAQEGRSSATHSERTSTEHMPSLLGFIQAVRLPLQEPLLLTTPRAHVPRGRDVASPHDEAWLPRRSSRLAAKSGFRDPNPERQAKRIMIAKWTGKAASHVADQAVDEEFRSAFEAATLSARKEAMAAMFPRRGNKTQPAGGRSTPVS